MGTAQVYIVILRIIKNNESSINVPRGKENRSILIKGIRMVATSCSTLDS